MDLGKRESQIAIITEAGELIEKRMRTERERLRQFFADRPQARILMESSTISEWVARLLEEVGLKRHRAASASRANNEQTPGIAIEASLGCSTKSKLQA